MGYYTMYKITEQLKITSLFSMFKNYYKPGFSFSGEYHDFWECVYVIDGSICASGNERVYSLSPGDIIIHKPMEFHKFHVDSPDGATLFIFSCSIEGALSSVLEERVFSLTEQQNEILLSLISYLDEKRCISEKSSPEHIDYIKIFYDFPTCPQMIASSLTRFFLTLCEDGNSTSVLTTPDAITFRAITTFMQNNIRKNLTIEDIARHCCLSPTSLKRIFSKYAGMSIHKYFIQMKLNKATLMLQDGISVTETSRFLGFSEQSYFSKLFKKHMGFSPSKCAQISRLPR